MEAELIVLDTAYSEVEWLKDLIHEFPIVPRHVPPIFIHTNSRSTIELLKQVNMKLNKHIQIRLKSAKCLMGKTVILDFVKSEKNDDDPWTN